MTQGMFFMQLILIGLQLMHIITTSWFLVLLPLEVSLITTVIWAILFCLLAVIQLLAKQRGY